MSWFKVGMEVKYQLPEEKVIIEKDENTIQVFKVGVISEIN